MKIRTQDLIGPSLDWAVAKANDTMVRIGGSGTVYAFISDSPVTWNPSENWSQAGPIIEREKITLDYDFDGQGLSLWTARKYAFDGTLLWAESGDSPLIASMRCFVESRLGDEVEIPDQLIK